MALRSLLPAVLLPVLALPTAEEFAFAPAEGTTLTKTFVVVYDMELQELAIEVEGQDVTEMIGEFEMTMTSETEVAVTDVYGAVEGGRPAKLERTFGELSSSSEVSGSVAGEGDSNTTEVESPLAGETVHFAWNAESGEYDVAWPEGVEGDAELLEGLEEDMDLRALLPEGPVEVGDSWTVPLKEMAWAVMPGGDLKWTNDELEEVEGFDVEELQNAFGDGFQGMLDELLAGECKVTLDAIADVDGVKVAQTSLVIEIDGAADMTDVLEEVIATLGESEEEMPEIVFDRADFVLEFAGEGTFEWNLAAGHARAFDVSGELAVGLELSVSVDMDGQGGSGDVVLELVGSFSESVAFE